MFVFPPWYELLQQFQLFKMFNFLDCCAYLAWSVTCNRECFEYWWMKIHIYRRFDSCHQSSLYPLLFKKMCKCRLKKKKSGELLNPLPDIWRFALTSWSMRPFHHSLISAWEKVGQWPPTHAQENHLTLNVPTRVFCPKWKRLSWIASFFLTWVLLYE